MEALKKLITIIIVVAALGWLYTNNQEKVDGWLDKNDLPSPTSLLTKVGRETATEKLEKYIKKKWTPEYVKDQLANYVIKDGISLPDGWKLETRKVEKTTITVIVPPSPENSSDYISPRTPINLKEFLPTPHLCKEDKTEGKNTIVCVIGSNLETHKVFHVLTFL